MKKELEAGQGGQKSPMKDVMKEVGFRYRSRQTPSAKEASSERSKGASNLVDVIEIADDESDKLGAEELDDTQLDDVARVLDFLTISRDQ